MRRLLHIILLCILCATAHAQYVFKGLSLSEALIMLDQSTKQYDISFVYDELEDFTVTKTIKRGRSLPEAVREVCGFYPVKVSVRGRDILVECIQKARTKLTGRLVGPDRQPITYANITLFLPSDTAYIGGGVSNEAGDFVIPCKASQARVRISCVGFKTIERVMPVGDAGTICMQIENNYIGNVTVNGRISLIRSKTDRLQYIVSHDEFAKGLTAQELLSRVPMIIMTGGQPMILGKGPAHLMLNGRVTDMGDEAILQKLWTIPSEEIARIEVISNPSGRDRLEMGGGYINIVLRKDQTLGWRGDVSAEAGVSDDWRGRTSGSLSYASEKFDMSFDVHGRRITKTTDNLTTYRVGKDERYFSNTQAKKNDKELAANLMLRYQPTMHLELGGMLSWQTLWPKTIIDGVFTFPKYNSNSETEHNPDNKTTAKDLTAYCDWRLDSKGRLLSLTYHNYKKDDEGSSIVSTDHNYPVSPGSQWWQNYNSHFDYHIQSARLDLTWPFGFATMDAGVSYTDIRNQADIEILDVSTYTPQHYENEVLDYREKTKAAYLSLHRDWDRLAVKAGLRYEHIGWNDDARDYWLPSANLSFKPWEGHQISLSWGTSTLRPNFYDLNPFRIYKSGYEYSEGNPMLKPSRMSNIELSYQGHKGLYACAYHRHGSNVVMQQTYFSTYRTQNRPLVVTMPYNLGRLNQTGLYLRYQRHLSKRLMATAEGDVFYHDAVSPNSDEPCLYGWGERIAVSSDWYLDRRHRFLLNARYQLWLADYHDMTEISGYGYFTFALRYTLLDDRLKLSLVANDPFRQHVTNETIHNSRIWTYDFIPYQEPPNTAAIMGQWSHIRHHSHYIGLTATYSFGGQKVRHVRHDLRDAESKRAEKQ